ncbi:MAG: PQQ-dependent sugar dehydrogenase [Bacteroidota bacterium]
MTKIYPSAKTIYSSSLVLLFIFSFFPQGKAQPVVGFNSVINTGNLPVGNPLVNPIDIVNAGDGTDRLFVVEQGGIIKAFDKDGAYLGNFLTVTGISSGGERGLLSMAFHPDYKNNGLFYVYYTNAAFAIEVARYHTPSGTPNDADPTSKKVLLSIDHSANNNHNGGKLNFGADGYLYFATGDGGGGGDVPNNAQHGDILLGKMIRINVTTDDTAPYYTIPPDNPFLVPGDNILDEIYSFGLRNPFRWSFDRLNHNMWLADVGQDLWEEVNFRPNGQTNGLNYGWHCIEGTHSFNGCAITTGVYAPPIFDYPHNNATGGFAIIGGYVYRGAANPAMYGYYIFADEVSHNVWLYPPGRPPSDTIQFKNALAGISAFGEAENGELYVTTLDGQVFNVTASGTSTLPVTLLDFKGAAKTGYNDLNWQTTNEVQLRQFEIEYSSDGLHFEQAGIVAAANSGAYHFTHTITSGKKLYYRLKMVDIDGKFEYSKTIIISSVNSAAKNFVTPSVVSNGMITVALADSYTGLQIMNMDGKIVYNESVSNRTGKINVYIPSVRSGQYLVRLFGNGKQLTQKILVQ